MRSERFSFVRIERVLSCLTLIYKFISLIYIIYYIKDLVNRQYFLKIG